MIHSFVLTIKRHENSEAAADRCIASGAKFEMPIQKAYGFTPKDNPVKVAEEEGISIQGFKEKFSRFDNCLAAFLGHYTLWKQCVNMDQEFQIFEHDAVIVAPLPEWLNYDGCISFGAPSYGKFNTPTTLGVNKLISKPYFPGAHAYRLRPDRALTLCHAAKTQALPTDVFLDVRRFSFLQEYYPWPVEARDDFTTIQNENGCLAKHRYGPGYQII